MNLNGKQVCEALGGMWTATHEDVPFQPLDEYMSDKFLEEFERVGYSPDNLVLENEEVN